MKCCSRCKQTKPVADFYAAARYRGGLNSRCKTCVKEVTRAADVRRRYGISFGTYRELIDRGCAVCGSRTNVVLDHCHASGAVRAPLCSPCNFVIGAVKEDPERLEALARYLREKKYVTVELLPVEEPRSKRHAPRVKGGSPRFVAAQLPVDEIQRLYDEGHSMAAIAERLDVSVSPIHAALRRSDAPLRRSGTVRRQLDAGELQRLYVDEGWDLAQVGEWFGVSVATVRNRLVELGVPRRPRSTPSRKTVSA